MVLCIVCVNHEHNIMTVVELCIICVDYKHNIMLQCQLPWTCPPRERTGRRGRQGAGVEVATGEPSTCPMDIISLQRKRHSCSATCPTIAATSPSPTRRKRPREWHLTTIICINSQYRVMDALACLAPLTNYRTMKKAPSLPKCSYIQILTIINNLALNLYPSEHWS